MKRSLHVIQITPISQISFIRIFGQDLVQRIEAYIRDELNGEQTPGSSFILETGCAPCRFIVCTSIVCHLSRASWFVWSAIINSCDRQESVIIWALITPLMLSDLHCWLFTPTTDSSMCHFLPPINNDSFINQLTAKMKSYTQFYFPLSSLWSYRPIT